MLTAISNNHKKRNAYFELAFPLFPVLAQYKFGSFAGSTVFLIVFAIMTVFSHNWKIHIDQKMKYFFYFLIFVIARDLIRCVLGPDSLQTQINRIIEYTLTFVLVFIVCSRDFDEDSLYTSWKFFGTIYCIGLLYHIVLIYILGQGAYPISIIPGYALRSEEAVVAYRPTSFFAEPSSFADAIIPLEFMSLKRKDIKIAIAATVFVLLSTSTVGVILSIILWLQFVMERDVSKKTKVFTFIVAIGIAWIFVNGSLFQTSYDKLLRVASGGSTVHSRITGSFDVVGSMDPLSLLFGTNYNEVNNYIANNLGRFASGSEAVKSWSRIGVFMNTIARTIFMYGIIGLMMFLLPFVHLLRKPDYNAKQYIIMIIVAAFGQTMLLNPYYFMVVIFALFFDKANMEVHGNE